MSDGNDDIRALAEYLNSLLPGPVADPARIRELLRKAWPALDGSDEDRTYAGKLVRAENFTWSPPWLRFDLERHGGTVLGSTRAEIHEWEVNLSARSAAICGTRSRQIRPMDQRRDITRIAAELADLIASRSDDERLVWASDRMTVRIKIGVVVPETVKQTTSDRRKRFTAKITPVLATSGWYPTRRLAHEYTWKGP